MARSNTTRTSTRYTAMDKTTINLPHQQKGTVLAISLIILLLMTLIAVTAMQTTTLEEKMAGNSRDRDLALQAAESALRDAEAVIELRVSIPSSDGTGIYAMDSTAVPDYSDPTTWTGTNSVAAATTITGIATPPRYYIEHIIQDSSDRSPSLVRAGYEGSNHDTTTSIFRITTQGVGSSTTSQVLLRSRYGKRF